MNKLEIAKSLDDAAFRAEPIAQISNQIDFTEEDAYKIQKMSMEERYARGEKFVGLKLGFTSYAKMEQMGVHDMIWGRLTDSMWLKLGVLVLMEFFIILLIRKMMYGLNQNR